jgi:hypothetical protein
MLPSRRKVELAGWESDQISRDNGFAFASFGHARMDGLVLTTPQQMSANPDNPPVTQLTRSPRLL